MLTTSIAVTEAPLAAFCLRHADDTLVLGHRLSEWSGKAPMLEEDLALSNIALDLIGQARALYQGVADQAFGEGDDLKLRLAQKGLDIARVRYEQGLSTYLEFTETNLALSSARLALWEARFECRAAAARLRYAAATVALQPLPESAP